MRTDPKLHFIIKKIKFVSSLNKMKHHQTWQDSVSKVYGQPYMGRNFKDQTII